MDSSWPEEAFTNLKCICRHSRTFFAALSSWFINLPQPQGGGCIWGHIHPPPVPPQIFSRIFVVRTSNKFCWKLIIILNLFATYFMAIGYIKIFLGATKLQKFAKISKNHPFQHVERASKWYQIQKIACGDISLRFYRDMTCKWSKMFLNHCTYILHVCGYHLEAVSMLRSCALDSYGGPIVSLQTLFLVPYLESGL